MALRDAAAAIRTGLPAVYQADHRAFAAADLLVVFCELRKYANQGLRFLEWGSGIGTITVMAGLLGYRAYGIERDERLVEVARELAAKAGSDARFGVGNFVLPDFRPGQAMIVPSEFAIAAGGPDGYAAIEFTPNEFDVIYVFPHPELIDTVHGLFVHSAKVGARLFVYCQSNEMLTSLRTPQGATPLTPA